MANYSDLKTSIQNVIKQNGANQITGNILQQTLISMINSLGANYTFAGVAMPSTNPGTPDQNVFYIAGTAGDYANFGNAAVYDNEIAVLFWNGSWNKLKVLRNAVTENFIKLDYVEGEYYSGYNTISTHPTYRRASIDVSKYVGKYLRVRFGYITAANTLFYPVGYCFYTGTYGNGPLSNLVIEKSDNFAIISIPVGVQRINVSWDYSVVQPFIYVDENYKDRHFSAIVDGILSSGRHFIEDVTSSIVESTQVGYYGKDLNIVNDDNWEIAKIKIDYLSAIRVVCYLWPQSVMAYVIKRNGVIIESNSMATLNASGSLFVDYLLVNKYAQNDNVEFYVCYNKNYIKFFFKPTDVYSKKSIALQMNEIEESFDMTPDGSGQWVLNGNVISANNNTAFKNKKIDLSKYLGRFVYINDSNNFPHNTTGIFISSGGTFTPIQSLITDSTNGCHKFKVPINNKKQELYISWIDRNVNPFVVVLKDFAEESSFRNEINETKEHVFITDKRMEGIIPGVTNLLDGVEFTNKQYYSAANTLSFHASYKSAEIDVSNIAGKTIFVSLGYGRNNSQFNFAYPRYCFVINSDGSSVALTDCKYKYTESGGYVTLPSNAKTIQISYDSDTKEPRFPVAYLEDPTENSAVDFFKGKSIFLFGDSISSTDYTWYRDSLKELTGADNVYNQGGSGWTAAMCASNAYFNRLNTYPSDFVVVLVGGNDRGQKGTIGTFSEDTKLYEMGEKVVSETNIDEDYNGTVFIQAVSHIIRKFRATYWNFRLNAGLLAELYDMSSGSKVKVYPTSGTATEKECIAYAKSQGWNLIWNSDHIMMCTETEEQKMAKLSSVRHPKMYVCTTLPQKRRSPTDDASIPENWERKRLAIMECCKKYNVPCIDLMKEFAIDWDLEPYYPGMGYNATNFTDNQGIYTMDGLHPNKFGYEYISRIVADHLRTR